jgi:lysophospholipase L1-like esterase
VTRARRRVALATTLFAAVFGVVLGLYTVRYHHWIAGGLRNPGLVRVYLTDTAFRHFVRVVEREDDHTDLFASMMDAGAGVMLSRHLFREVLMDGAPRYMYQPNLRKLAFRTGARGVYRSMETRDVPAIRDALAPLDTVVMATATYDERGFRRATPDLTRDCDLTVMFLGDSFTDGLWVNDSDTFVNAYGRRAREHGTRACPVNTGVNGYGTPEEAWVLEHYYAAAGNPRIVFVMHYPNDLYYDDDAVARGETPDGEERWTANLASLDRIERFTRDRGAVMVLAAIPVKPQVFNGVTGDYYQQRLRAYAESRRIPFVDLLTALPVEGRAGFFWSWDPHFTPAGHRAVADALYRATASLIPAAAR